MKLQIRRTIQLASIIGLAAFLTAGSASAYPITFNTSAAGTGFGVGGALGLTLGESSGANATLAFTPNFLGVHNGPTNINLGNFVLACATCTTPGQGAISAVFDAFTFELILTDVTDGAVGRFTGSSAGGEVFLGVSPININWVPLQLGPNTNNAISGDFGGTIFTTTSYTGIVAPNSGETPGQTTVQGTLESAPIPEPATLGLVGIALLGLGALGRKKLNQQ